MASFAVQSLSTFERKTRDEGEKPGGARKRPDPEEASSFETFQELTCSLLNAWPQLVRK